jgi:hypothetical protein
MIRRRLQWVVLGAAAAAAVFLVAKISPSWPALALLEIVLWAGALLFTAFHVWLLTWETAASLRSQGRKGR